MGQIITRVLERLYELFGRFVPCDIANVYRLNVHEARAPSVPATDFEFRFLTSSEMRKFATVDETDMSEDAAKLVDEGHVACFAALKNGELAAYACFATGVVDAEHNRASRQLAGIGLRLDADVRYLFKAFAVPRFRGFALMSWVIVKASEHYQTNAVNEFVTTTGWTNRAFQVSAERAGFVVKGRTAEVFVFGRHYYRLPPLIDAPFELFGGSS